MGGSRIEEADASVWDFVKYQLARLKGMRVPTKHVSLKQDNKDNGVNFLMR
jgi:hypothetical protein